MAEEKRDDDGNLVNDEGKRINKDGSPWTGDGVQDAHRSDGKPGGNDIGIGDDDDDDDAKSGETKEPVTK